MADIVQFEAKTLCPFCGKREATRLCDMPLGRARWAGHPPRVNGKIPVGEPLEHTIMCSRPICDVCAVNIGTDIDICPRCAAMIARKANRN